MVLDTHPQQNQEVTNRGPNPGRDVVSQASTANLSHLRLMLGVPLTLTPLPPSLLLSPLWRVAWNRGRLYSEAE